MKKAIIIEEIDGNTGSTFTIDLENLSFSFHGDSFHEPTKNKWFSIRAWLEPNVSKAIPLSKEEVKWIVNKLIDDKYDATI